MLKTFNLSFRDWLDYNLPWCINNILYDRIEDKNTPPQRPREAPTSFPWRQSRGYKNNLREEDIQIAKGFPAPLVWFFQASFQPIEWPVVNKAGLQGEDCFIKEGYFTNVLKCFYGFTIEIPRTEIVEYYPIIKFLEVESLLKLLREDMTSRAESYDVFVLLQLAHRFN